MISAPLRTTEPKSTTPSIKTQGHLALLEWEETAPSSVNAAQQMLGDPLRKSVMDRCYDGGIVVLLAVTLAAMAATLGSF